MQQLLTQHQSLYYAWQLTRRTASRNRSGGRSIVTIVSAVQWNKKACSVFKNKADCQSVKGRLMAALAQPNQRGDHIVQANIKSLIDRTRAQQQVIEHTLFSIGRELV